MFPLFLQDFHRSTHKESSLVEARPEFFLADRDHRYYDIDWWRKSQCNDRVVDNEALNRSKSVN